MSAETFSCQNMALNRKIPRAMCPLYEFPFEVANNIEMYSTNQSQLFPPLNEPVNEINNRINHSVHPSQINTPGWVHPSQRAVYPVPIDPHMYPSEMNPSMYQPEPNQYINPSETDPYIPNNHINWQTYHSEQNQYNSPSELIKPLQTSNSTKTSSTKSTHWHPSTYQQLAGGEPEQQSILNEVTCQPRGLEISDSNTVYHVFDCLTQNNPNQDGSSSKIGKLYLESGLIHEDPKESRPVGVRVRPRKRSKKKNILGRNSNPRHKLNRRKMLDTCSSSSAASVGPFSRYTYTNPTRYSDIERSEEETMSRRYPPGSHYTQTDMTHSTPRTTQTETNQSVPRTSHTQTENKSNSRKTQTASSMKSSKDSRSSGRYPTERSNGRCPTERSNGRNPTDRTSGRYATDRSTVPSDFDGNSMRSSGQSGSTGQSGLSGQSGRTGQSGQSGQSNSSPNRMSNLSSRTRSLRSSCRSSKSRGSGDSDCPAFFEDVTAYIPGLFVVGIAVGIALCFVGKTLQQEFYTAAQSFC